MKTYRRIGRWALVPKTVIPFLRFCWHGVGLGGVFQKTSFVVLIMMFL